MKGSLRARMTLGFTISFGLFALSSCFAFFLWSRHSARIDAEERVSSATEHLILEWKGRTPEETFVEVHEDARLDRVSMLLLDLEGKVLAADGHPPLRWPLPTRGWIAQAKRVPQGRAVAGMPWEPILEEIHGRTALLIVFAILATSAVGAAAWFLVGRTLRPIGLLAEGADAASADPLQARLVTPSEDAEMTHLVATLNGFLKRLGDGARSREEFYASAAHELRTPLSILSAEIEVALSLRRSQAEHEETLRDLQFQTRRLISLVEGLLTLNRIQMSPEPVPEIVDLGDLVASTLSNLDPIIRERRLNVHANLGEIHSHSGQTGHLSIVVRNLLENAVRYAPVEGHIEVVSGEAFCIRNEFPVDSPLDLERIFEPFVQGDGSRSSVGNGLGLAICRRIAEVNGWRLNLRREGGFIVSELEF